ncbi:RND superfamily putative drug exporter [Bacillus pakistanensis]|uniref:RND superfamily putative drug exporter n=1 Tax=Rossellomorea pakistanensis TaxID=992288 RepID=A0ABS2N881_9BACI|nr:MMPL family transporter [Bacillus pakistanensis]MBM7584075.1 RND superfamily putative drug exporter [Bacillus pakistanensis]
MKLLSKIIDRLYKGILAFWIIVAVGFGFFATQLPSILGGDGFRTDGEYEKVQEELTSTFEFSDSTLLLLFERKPNQSQEEFKEEIRSTLTTIKDNVTLTIQSPLNQNEMMKKNYAYAQLHFNKDNIEDDIKDIESITNMYSNMTLTGEPIITRDINKASQDDLKRAEMIGVPVAIVVLLFAFGSIIASIVPIVIGGVTVIVSFGVLTLIGEKIELSIFLLNVVPMIGLALSIDFALLFINRYREEMKLHNKREAITNTIATAGKSIIFSALCVFIGLAAMMVIEIDIFQTIAIGGMVVVSIAVISSLTLLPAILLLMGSSINKWRIIKLREHDHNKWKGFARFVMKRPVLLAVIALVMLIIGIIPVQHMNLAIPEVDSLPENYESRQAFETIQDQFHFGEGSTVYMVVNNQSEWTSEKGLSEMEAIISSIEDDHLVKEIDSVFSATGIETSQELVAALQHPEMKKSLQPALDSFVNKDKLLVPIHLNVEESSDEANDWIRDRSNIQSENDIFFGGQVKFNQEIFDEIYNKIALCLAIILISTYTILMFAFRSVIIPLKAILMNIIGLTSTFGVLVWIFQGGHFGLGENEIALVLPVLVFSLVFGLSMDYEVFLISRIHEIYQKTGNNTEATIEGLASTSKIITSAALIMIVITGAFAFTGVMPVKQIGVGIAVAIFIDATIIRMLLVPSLMKLLGDWNWWMPFVSRTKKGKRKSKRQPVNS